MLDRVVDPGFEPAPLLVLADIEKVLIPILSKADSLGIPKSPAT